MGTMATEKNLLVELKGRTMQFQATDPPTGRSGPVLSLSRAKAKLQKLWIGL